MWRRNLAGGSCLFVGADERVISALKNCFGWDELGRVNGPDDVMPMAERLASSRCADAPVVAVCLFEQAQHVSKKIDSEPESNLFGYAKLAQGVFAAVKLSPRREAERGSLTPKMLYFVEESLHASDTLVEAIGVGADAYFGCVRGGAESAVDLDIRIIYRKRGIALERQLPVSAVMQAQGLSPFQTRVMHCLRRDIFTDKTIAGELGTTEKMVGKTICQLFEIYGCNRRSALAKHSVYL